MNERHIVSKSYPGFVPDGQGGYHKPKPGGSRSFAESQRIVGQTPDEAREDQTPYSGKCIVRITRVGERLLDKDNLYGGVKYHVDALRYHGLIREDNPEAIELEVYQDTIQKRGGVERTEIKITLIPNDIIHQPS